MDMYRESNEKMKFMDNEQRKQKKRWIDMVQHNLEELPLMMEDHNEWRCG